jgi:addiction module HigA family antidote
MPIKAPPHPGQSVRHDCIEPLGLTITEAADALGVTRQTLNNLVNGKMPCTKPASAPNHQVYMPTLAKVR